MLLSKAENNVSKITSQQNSLGTPCSWAPGILQEAITRKHLTKIFNPLTHWLQRLLNSRVQAAAGSKYQQVAFNACFWSSGVAPCVLTGVY
jgi:hypothetical protein